MIKFILVIGIIVNGVPETKAFGPFSSQENCWKFFSLNNRPELDLISSCYDEKTFREFYPHLQLERNES